MRFCQSFMTEWFKYVGADTDVPAGDIGTGAREIGYMYGQYKRITGLYEGVLTGKGLTYGGSLGRKQATGYGLCYFVKNMLEANGKTVDGQTVVVSGSGNVAIYAAEKITQMGAKVVAMSDSNGYVYDKNGIDLACVKQIKEVRRGRIKEYLDVHPEGYSRAIDWSAEVSERLCDEFFGGDWYAMCRSYYELEAQVYDRLSCTFVGHFDLITRFNDQMRSFDENDPRYTTPALDAMEYLVAQEVPFEINCGAHNRGRKEELYPRCSLLRALHDFGGQILINSDAHQTECLNGSFDVAVQRAIACGFTHVNVLAHTPTGAVEMHQIPLDTL
jgi:hypothetical protein